MEHFGADRLAGACKPLKDGAGDGTRTHDVQLGKLAFYH